MKLCCRQELEGSCRQLNCVGVSLHINMRVSKTIMHLSSTEGDEKDPQRRD